MGASVKYLRRDEATGRLSYRREFATKLRPYIPGQPRELKRTLQCTDIGDPQCAARFAEAGQEYERTVAMARKTQTGAFDPLSDQKIAYLTACYRTQLLAADSDARLQPPTDRRNEEERREYHMNNVFGQKRLKEENARLEAQSYSADAAALAVTIGLRFDPSTLQFARLCALLMDVRIEVAEVIVRRDHGEARPTPLLPAHLTPTGGRDRAARRNP